MKSILISLGLPLLLVGGCNGQRASLTDVSLEMKALEYFVDSILYKTYYYQTDSDAFVLPPPSYKENWKEEGIFSGYVIYSEGVKNISEPYFDAHTLSLDSSELTNMDYKIAKEFLADYNFQIKKNVVPKNLVFPDVINKLTYSEFEKLNEDSSLFLDIRMHLTASEGYLVQLFLENNKSENYQFYIFFDKNKEVTGWNIK